MNTTNTNAQIRKKEEFKRHFEWEKGNEGHQITSGSEGTGFSVMQALPSKHERKYLLNEIPLPWSLSPNGTSAHQNAISNAVRARRILHTSGPPAKQRERWAFCCAKTKRKISLHGQHHLTNRDQNTFMCHSKLQSFSKLVHGSNQAQTGKKLKSPFQKTDLKS